MDGLHDGPEPDPLPTDEPLAAPGGVNENTDNQHPSPAESGPTEPAQELAEQEDEAGVNHEVVSHEAEGAAGGCGEGQENDVMEVGVESGAEDAGQAASSEGEGVVDGGLLARWVRGGCAREDPSVGLSSKA
jgi:hypothetical protein